MMGQRASATASDFPNLPAHVRGHIGGYLQPADVFHTAAVTSSGPDKKQHVQHLAPDVYTFTLRRATNRQLEIVSQRLPSLTELNLTVGYRVTDVGLQYLSRLPLQTINITCVGEGTVTDTGVLALVRPQLKSINLDGCKDVTDVGATALAHCSRLQNLNLSWCRQVTDVGLAALATGCPELQTLDVFANWRITDVGLTALAEGCKQLRALTLRRCHGITDVGVAALGQCTRLQTLDLSYTKAADAGVAALAQCTRLQTLDLSHTKVTNAGVAALAALPLQTVNVEGTEITGAWKDAQDLRYRR